MTMLLQREATNSQFRKTPLQSVKRPPSYLYLRGSIYYFRYALSETDKARFGHSEVRVSLRTGFLHDARKRAKHLRMVLEAILADFTLKDWEKLKAKMSAELKEMMDSCPDKKPIQIAEIRKRMDAYLNTLLDEADAKAQFPPDNPSFRGAFPENMPVDKMLDDYLWLHQAIVDKPDLLKSTYYPYVIFQLLGAQVISLEELTDDNIIPILNEYQKKIHIARNRILYARSKGDYSYERTFYPPPQPSIAIQENSEQEDKPQLLLSQFIKLFVDTKIGDGKWTKRNVPTHQNRIETLIDILGDIPVLSIDRTMMRKYREILVKLPPNRRRSKDYKNKSIPELLEMNIEKTLDMGTINTTLETISGMFEWGIKEGILEKNPAKELTLKDERQAIELRDALTDEDIGKVFFSGDYTPKQVKNPAYFWVPLIGLYTGMRLEEICQLHIEDIYEENGVWIFDIKTESLDGLNDKILKTKNATRKIPIHPDLIELGLLEYRDKTGKTNVRLFPELKKTDKSPKYGKQPGKQFGDWIKKKRIEGKKSFHSLRHTFSDYFKKLNMHNDIFRYIFGHEADKLAARQYGSKFPPRQCYDELISKIYWKKKE